jgi:hypothetical protein
MVPRGGQRGGGHGPSCCGVGSEQETGVHSSSASTSTVA